MQLERTCDSACAKMASVIVVALVATMLAPMASSSDITCANMRYTYNGNGFNARDVPKEPVLGNDLRICKANQSCCTAEMEGKLAEKSGRDFEQMLRREYEEVRNAFKNKANKFDEYFRELLRNSRKDFHRLFKGTYGVLYEQNSHVFVDLFRDLEEYYDKGRIDLTEALRKFFSVLYQKMFTVLNSQFNFDEAYLRCVTRHMEDLKPFGDVPQKLSFQVKRSFVASRTYVQGLRSGRDVMGEILKVRMSSSCNDAVMRMTSCPACNGLRSDTKPCLNYCLNVMRGCLALHAELHTFWDEFVDALLKVGGRLEGSFNIEEVVDPIAIQISDAIMNFQENGNAVSQKVFKGCGQPRLGKRSVSPASLASDRAPLSFDSPGPESNRGGGGGKDDFDPITAAGTSIRRIVKDVREKIERLKGFWHELPSSICSGESTGRRYSSQFAASAPSSSSSSKAEDGQCWTGTEKGTYPHALVAYGLKNQGTNPEVTVDPFGTDTTVNGQILDMKLITSKLLKAYDGVNVQWVDYQDWKQSSRWTDSTGKSTGQSSGTDGKPSEQYPYAYPWASGMAKEENSNTDPNNNRPASSVSSNMGYMEGSGELPIPAVKTGTNLPPDVEHPVEGSGQAPAPSGTDLSHADDEDFPFAPPIGKKADHGEQVEGSGAVAPPAGPTDTAGSRPRPPAPPITGDPITRVSSEEFDDFQRKYDNDFFGKKEPKFDTHPKQTTVKPKVQEEKPSTPRKEEKPVRKEEKPSGTSKTAPASDSSRAGQSLLWSVFAPIVVTWIGGIIV